MATRKKTNSSSAKRKATRGTKAQRQAVAIPRLGSTANDIVGLLLVVLAVAMIVALQMPSPAPVTYVTGEALELLFGAGAMLFPITLLVFALTFFIDNDEPLSGRLALGLTLVTLAVLSIVSITYPGAADNSALVLDHEVLRVRGGYVGGGIAWALLRSVGREVGIVVLIGAIIAGIVICGFSITDTVARVSEGIAALFAAIRGVGEEYRARWEEHQENLRAERMRDFADYEDDYDDEYAYDDLPAYDEEPKTTYIGARKSTVLTRNIVANSHLVDDRYDQYEEEEPRTQRKGGIFADAVTSLLQRRPFAADDYDDYEDYDEYDEPYDDEPYEDDYDEPAEDVDWEEPAKTTRVAREETIPDFLIKDKPAEEQPAVTQKRKTARRAPAKAAAGAAAGAAAATAGAASASAKAAPKTIEPSAPQRVNDANVKVKNSVATSRPGDDDDTYDLPPLSMLSSNPQSASSASSKAEIDQTMARLQGTLREFGLTSRVVDYVSGPLVTTFRVEMGEGERVNKIRNLEDDIALTLAAEKVRIFAPIAGTSYVGIEIPNKTRQNVHLGDVLPYAKGGPLEVAIGRDSAGKPVIADIAKMPHMLVAGTTGSGKSVMINSMIMSLLMRATPKQVRLIMVDPKRVEFRGYNGIPHLYVPVVTEPRQAASALQWAVSEMERRLKVFERAGARNITVYNNMCTKGKLSEMDNPPEPMPYLVIVIDELSDLMMVAGKDVEASIVRIAQLARAAGIHLVIATQRPSANVVTGLIKSNIDSRVALKVSSGIDSRVILDETGADRLLGNGDMLFKDRGLAPKRVLGCFASDPEIESVVDFIRGQGEPDYHEEILSAVVPGQPGGGGAATVDDADDPLIWEAAQIVVESQLGSTSGLQRRLKVGYARAGRIMDMLEAKGVVGPSQGSKPREVLLDEEGLEDLRVQEEKYREV